MRYLSTMVRFEIRIVSRDRLFVVLLFIIPAVLIGILGQAFADTQGSGGLEQTVPGFTVLFSASVVTFTGYAFYRDVWWSSWERTMTQPVPRLVLILGKSISPFLLGMLQQVLLIGGGLLLLDLSVSGSWLVLGLAMVLNIAVMVGIGTLLAALTSTPMQLGQLSYLFMILGGALGGALVPFEDLPGWARIIGQVLPQRHAVRAMRAVLETGAGFAELGESLLVLIAYTVVLGVLVATRFDLRKRRQIR